MDTEMPEPLRALAIEWHIRLRHGGDADWEAFAEWLGEDPAHAEAYDLIEQTDQAIEPLLPDLVFHEAANDAGDPPQEYEPVRRSGRWLWGSGALAASIALTIGLGPHLLSSRYEILTGPGEHRTVMLDPTTKIMLNGSTRMTFDHDNPRFAALASGEALFQIRHDSARPFRLEVGDNRVEDVGTVFNVVHDADEVRVAVAEGKVIYNPGRAPVALDAGQALVDRPSSGTVRVIRTAAEAVGTWEKGRLIYAGEPLSQVASDLGRSLGIRITVSPAIAGRSFFGTIVLDGTGAEQLQRLAPALNVTLQSDADGWTMKPADGAVH
ncbi:FecR family protein [Sphingomonas sp. YR710]|uniref:FecR family protein n=1 Tax=Sphingomonas sp. YR710 TaxID=1882773 RepID=UPI0008842438|nr:FecR domain-containing protein [Sphingomonas sp. YR710]SDD05725.1 FecR family protein [Sphingomonas sp. YR710]